MAGKFNIDTIVGHVRNNPLFEPNRYEVIISGPVEISEHMMFNCAAAGVPGHNIGSFEHSIIGPKRKIPNEELFDDLTLTFYNGQHHYEITTIFNWMKKIAGGDSYRIAYYNDIVADINIVIYDLLERKTLEVEIAEAYPIGMAEVELGYAAELPSQTVVNFAYHSYDLRRYINEH